MNQIIGVLWQKEKDGKEYYSGVLNDLRGKINIAVFPNTFKQAENQPDMNIVISWGRELEKTEDEAINDATTQESTKKKEESIKDDLPF